MAQKILVTNFTFDMTLDEFENTTTQLAPEFSAVPGCQWKIWLIDREKKEAGAVYLFESNEALQHFKNSPLVASVLSHPALGNFDLKERDIVAEASRINHAPLMQEAMA